MSFFSPSGPGLLHLRGAAQGVGRGVGKAEAAGIGGHGDIQGLPDGQLRQNAHGLQQQKHKLSRRRGLGLQQKPFRIAGVGGVMIDAKGHPSAI